MLDDNGFVADSEVAIMPYFDGGIVYSASSRIDEYLSDDQRLLSFSAGDRRFGEAKEFFLISDRKQRLRRSETGDIDSPNSQVLLIAPTNLQTFEFMASIRRQGYDSALSDLKREIDAECRANLYDHDGRLTRYLDESLKPEFWHFKDPWFAGANASDMQHDSDEGMQHLVFWGSRAISDRLQLLQMVRRDNFDDAMATMRADSNTESHDKTAQETWDELSLLADFFGMGR